MTKHRPLRQWNAPSYDPVSGRAASGIDGAGLHGKPSRQLPPTHGVDQKMGEASRSQQSEAKRQRGRPGLK